MYEGRTRGKRMKYTYSDEEDQDTDATNNQRSSRTQGFPGLPTGPMTTSSGRQVRTRYGNLFGTHNAAQDSEGSIEPEMNGRATRSNRIIDNYDADGLNEDGDSVSSEHEWQGEDEAEDVADYDEDEDMSQASDEDIEPHSLVVTLQYRKPLKKEVDAIGKVEGLSNPSLPTPDASSNGFMPKLEDKQTITSSAVLPSPPNGVETKHQVQTTLPSFSKFLYNQTNGGQNERPLDTFSPPTYKPQLQPQPQPQPQPQIQSPPQPNPQFKPQLQSSTTAEVNHHRPW